MCGHDTIGHSPRCTDAAPPAPAASFIVRGATIVDGTGSPSYIGSVRVTDGTIAQVAAPADHDALSPTPNEPVYDAAGLVLAPGFIDTHSHHDGGLLEELGATAAVSQGITTIVVGQDGGSRFPLGDFFSALAATPAAVNVASYVGHGTLRRQVMGDDFRRAATEDEVAAMRALLESELASWAIGLSTGLEYDPGIYSTTDEVVALAMTAAASGGRYISHMRSEDRALHQAVEETIEIAERARLPVQISHFKLAARGLWGQASRHSGPAGRGARRRPRHHGRRVPVRVLAVDHDRALPRARLRQSRGRALRTGTAGCPRRHADRQVRPRSHARRQDPGRDFRPARHRSRHDLHGSDCGVAGCAGRWSRRQREHRRHEHDLRRHRHADVLAPHQHLVRRGVAGRASARLGGLPESAGALRARRGAAGTGRGRSTR